MKLSKRIWTLVFCVVFAVVLFSACSTTGSQPTDSTAQANDISGIEELSYSVSIDVNPSIELRIVNGTVNEVIAYNDDGQNILLNVNVTGLGAEDAVAAIVNQLVSEGYISSSVIDPCLIIAVNDDGQSNTEISEKLKECAEEVIDGYSLNCNIASANVTEDISSKAEQLGLSAGRYMILDYIVQKEGITMDQAIQTYGSLKIGELMKMFDGIEDIFSGEDMQENDELNDLTAEQLAVLNPAFETLKEEVKKAEMDFHETFKDIKKEYKDKLAALKKQYKNKDGAALKAEIDKLRVEMLSERQTALDTLNELTTKARDNFKLAVAALGITEDRLDNYINWHVNKEINIEDNLKDFLKDFYYKVTDNINDNTLNNTNTKKLNNNGNKGNAGGNGQDN